MNKLKPALALLLVFIAGAALGVVGTRIVVRRVVSQMLAEPQKIRERVEVTLTRKLKLDPAQRRRLHQILVESQGQLREVRMKTQPQIALISSNAQAQFSAVLTPAQQEEFEKIREKNRRLLPLPLAGPAPRPPAD
jgi:hypothetical protein